MVKKCGREKWEKFRRYHYLNTDLAMAAKCYGVYDDNNIIAFMGVIHQPHGVNKKIKRCTRLVVLPDYQGIGVGYQFLRIVAQYYKQAGFDFSIVTSAKNLIWKLYNSNDWVMRRLSVNSCDSEKSVIDYQRSSMRTKCKTASFFYKGDERLQQKENIKNG